MGFHFSAVIPTPVSLHREHHVIPRSDFQVDAGEFLVREQMRGFNDWKPAAIGHGVSAIHRKIHNHLFQVSRIGPNDAGILFQRQHQIDVLSDEPPQHLFYISHQVVQ